MLKIRATEDTFFKKSVNSVDDLDLFEKLSVPANSLFEIERQEDAEGEHCKVLLASDRGSWYIWKPHWDLTWESNRAAAVDDSEDGKGGNFLVRSALAYSHDEEENRSQAEMFAYVWGNLSPKEQREAIAIWKQASKMKPLSSSNSFEHEERIPTVGIELIEEFEGFEHDAYEDPIYGWRVPTIGYGTTRYPDGRKVRQGDYVSKEEARKYLRHEVEEILAPRLEKIPTWNRMNPNQRGALYSFGFNLGAHFYRGKNFTSITRVCDSPNRWGDKAWVEAQFIKYRNPGSRAEAGLLRRRKAEAALFCTPMAGEVLPTPPDKAENCYIAKYDTLLKQQPVEGSTLGDGEKEVVKAGTSLPVKKVLDNCGLHAQVEFEHNREAWWLFVPHWDTAGDGEVTAEFSLKLAKSHALIMGDLVFFQDGLELKRVEATSGQRGYQHSDRYRIRAKGCIPPDIDWQISTDGYHLRSSGINGMFYHITPDPDPQTGRGEFGLHQDANYRTYPGSAGCIVVLPEVFKNEILPLMEGLRGRQSHVPLRVIYS